MATNKASVVSVVGIEDVRALLMDKVPDQAHNLMRAAVHGIAGEIAKGAKQRVPVDTGNLKKSIMAKRRKSTKENPVSEVHVTRGKAVKNDGFYWRFVEYGTGSGAAGPQPERPFLRPAVDAVRADMRRILEEQVTKKLSAAVKRAQKKKKVR